MLKHCRVTAPNRAAKTDKFNRIVYQHTSDGLPRHIVRFWSCIVVSCLATPIARDLVEVEDPGGPVVRVQRLPGIS
jgi:hypothetical protein